MSCSSSTGQCVNHGACNQNDGCIYGAKKRPGQLSLPIFSKDQQEELKIKAILAQLYKGSVPGLKERITITYTYPSGETSKESGCVGLSTGISPCFLLVHNRRSMGGSPIVSFPLITEIRQSRYRGQVLYKRAT